MPNEFPFDVVVVTFPDEGAARVALGGPIQVLQGNYPKTQFLATCDPLGCRCGSGGGTLAALEHVELQVGTADTKTILILHAGGDSSRCFTQMALGKAWTNLPLMDTTSGKAFLSNPIHVGMDSIARIFTQYHCLPKGSVVVAASDALLSIPHCSPSSDRDQGIKLESSEHGKNDNIPVHPDVLGVAFPAPWETAKNHGVYVLAEPDETVKSQQGVRAMEVPIHAILQKPSLETLQQQSFAAFGELQTSREGLAWIDNGIIAFLPAAAKSLHELAHGVLQTTTESGLLGAFEKRKANEPQLTYQDVTHKVDLYTHFLQALTMSVEPRSNASTDARRQTYLRDHASDLDPAVANGIFDALSPLRFMSLAIPKGKFLHLGTTRELIDFYVYGCRQVGGTNNTPSNKVADSVATSPDASRRELYTRNCTYFGQELGMVRRMHAFAKLMGENRSKNREKVLPIGEDCILMGCILEGEVPSRIGEGTVVEFCSFTRVSVSIGKNCLISGLRHEHMDGQSLSSLEIPNDSCVQMMPLTVDGTMVKEPSVVLMALGVNDPIKKPISESTLFGMKLEEFLDWAQLSPEYIWDSSAKRTIWNAKLHPVVTNVSRISFDQLWDWVNHLPTTRGVASAARKRENSLQLWKNYPRLSLSQVRDLSDAAEEYRYRQHLVHNKIPARQREHCQAIADTLRRRQHTECDFSPLLEESSQAMQGLETLDEVIQASLLDRSQYDVCGRAFMVQSAVLDDLAKMAATEIDARQQVASTEAIREECSFLLQAIQSPTSSGADRQKAYTEIVHIRKRLWNWKSDSRDHLKSVFLVFSDMAEEIARMMTEVCVAGFLSENTLIGSTTSRRKAAVHGQWCVARAPARVDLAGGWTDTPPVCYEYGSTVTGMAVAVDGKKPLSSRCRVLPSLPSSKEINDHGIIFMRSELRNSVSCELISAMDTKLHSLEDLRDARDPSASCALIKCALVCLGFIPVDYLEKDMSDKGGESLQDLVNIFCQAEEGNNVRMEIVVTSLLPQGSGMGTSSILGGCVLAAVGRCVGIELSGESTTSGNVKYTMDSVLALEQILSTGGGFQDQVNGLIGGFKTVSSAANYLPIQLSIEKCAVDPAFQKILDEKMLLAFTGKTRLAKNILQNVLRRWAKRTPEVVDTVRVLVEGAHEARAALQSGNLEGLGKCLGRYYEQKKNMAGRDSGVEPDIVRSVLEKLQNENLIYGGSLCGAGGGGFMVMIASNDADTATIHSTVDEVLSETNHDDAAAFSWHECHVCDEGLVTNVLPLSGAIASIDDFDASWHYCGPDREPWLSSSTL